MTIGRMSEASTPPAALRDAAPQPPEGVPPAHIPHPWHFLVLVIPFGVNSGFVGLPITYALTQRHISSVEIAGLLALSYLPQSWKFLWAPVVDTTFTRKGWYIASALLTGLGTWIMAWSTDRNPTSMLMLTAWVIASSFASTLVGMSIESLMAGVVPDSWRGRVAGWYQAGNLGGLGLSSGLALWLMQSAHWSGTLTGFALFAMCLRTGDGDHCLLGERLQQGDLAVREPADRMVGHCDAADGDPVADHRNANRRTNIQTARGQRQLALGFGVAHMHDLPGGDHLQRSVLRVFDQRHWILPCIGVDFPLRGDA